MLTKPDVLLDGLLGYGVSPIQSLSGGRDPSNVATQRGGAVGQLLNSYLGCCCLDVSEGAPRELAQVKPNSIEYVLTFESLGDKRCGRFEVFFARQMGGKSGCIQLSPVDFVLPLLVYGIVTVCKHSCVQAAMRNGVPSDAEDYALIHSPGP